MESMWSNIVKTDGCWIWKGATFPNGYGRFNIFGEIVYAHRLMFVLFKGKIPDSFNICHTCDVRNCVNPDHLFAGTQKDNIQDMIGKKRHAPAYLTACKGAKNGMARLTDEDVIKIRTLHRSGGTSFIELSKMFGVTSSMIGMIVRRNNWKHLP